MAQFVNPAKSALDAFGTIKNIQMREEQADFLEEKRQAFRVDREYTLEERKRQEQEREAKRTFAGIQANLFDENGNYDQEFGNEILGNETLAPEFAKRANELTGRDDVVEVRAIQADSALAEQYPELEPGTIVPLGRTKDDKVIPLVDGESGEALTLDRDDFAGVITGAAAEAGQFDVVNGIIEGRRANAQRESVADLGRSFKGETTEGGAGTALPDQDPTAAAQAQPGGGSREMPDNDLTPEEIAEELSDTSEEIAALEEGLDDIQGDISGDPRQVATRRQKLRSRLQQAQQRKAALENGTPGATGEPTRGDEVASEEEQLRGTAEHNGRQARQIRARLKEAQNNGRRANATIDMRNEQIDQVASLAETGAIDAKSMFDMIDTIRNPDVDTTTTKTDNWIITTDQQGNELNRVPINPNGSGLSADEERDLRKDQLSQGRAATDQLIKTLGLEEGGDRAQELRRLSSNTTALLDPTVMNIDATLQQAVNDMDQYIDNNNGFWSGVVEFFGGPEEPEVENQRDLMPFVLARSMLPDGADSPTKSALDAMKDHVDMVRGSLKDAQIRGAATERTAFSALSVLAKRGADQATLDRATKRLSTLIETQPQLIQEAASTKNGALALAAQLTR